MENVIGYAVVSEAFDYHPSQEFAGASETVRVPAGRYAIVFSKPYWRSGSFGIRLEGTLTYRGWFGTNTRVEHPNTPASEFSHRYGYELAFAVLRDGGRLLVARDVHAQIELCDGIEAKPIGGTASLFRAGEELSIDGLRAA